MEKKIEKIFFFFNENNQNHIIFRTLNGKVVTDLNMRTELKQNQS